jgi:hypothetical protein
LPTIASLVVARAQQKKLSKRRAVRVLRVVKRLLGRPTTAIIVSPLPKIRIMIFL